MILKQNQLLLIRHLAQYETLDYESCLRLLDTDKTNDRTALSYAFRPLTKNKFISKHKNGNVNILSKGRALFPEITPLVTLGGGITGNKRINSVSKIAALFNAIGIESVSSPQLTECECFVPSVCWRKIRTSILSTVRFAGIYFTGERRFAVYDIGDGKIEWQLRAERSLFFINFFEAFSTHATGMIFICDDDKRVETAINIIHKTMRQRKRLIEYESYYARTRPIKYSKSPIQLAWYYESVYLTTPNTLEESLNVIKSEDKYIRDLCGKNEYCENKKHGDFVIYPYRYFVNPATDLLKFVYFFTDVKSELMYGMNPQYGIYLRKQDFPILQMYPKISGAEGVKINEINEC